MISFIKLNLWKNFSNISNDSLCSIEDSSVNVTKSEEKYSMKNVIFWAVVSIFFVWNLSKSRHRSSKITCPLYEHLVSLSFLSFLFCRCIINHWKFCCGFVWGDSCLIRCIVFSVVIIHFYSTYSIFSVILLWSCFLSISLYLWSSSGSFSKCLDNDLNLPSESVAFK